MARAPRRDRFALEYLKDLNATNAALRCGYSKRSAASQGSRLLKDRKIAAEIAAGARKHQAIAEITIERTLKEIARLAYADIRKLYDPDGNLKPIHELDEDAAATIAGIESFEEFAGVGEDRVSVGMVRKVKHWDKGSALEKCMAYLGLHKTGQPAGTGGLNLSINLSPKGRAK